MLITFFQANLTDCSLFFILQYLQATFTDLNKIAILPYTDLSNNSTDLVAAW